MSVKRTVEFHFFFKEDEGTYYQEQVFNKNYVMLSRSYVPSRAHHLAKAFRNTQMWVKGEAHQM